MAQTRGDHPNEHFAFPGWIKLHFANIPGSGLLPQQGSSCFHMAPIQPLSPNPNTHPPPGASSDFSAQRKTIDKNSVPYS